MWRSIKFCPAVLALAVMGMMTATANAESVLPVVLLLPGTTEVEAKASSATAKTKFTGIQNTTGEGYRFTVHGSDMAELGAGETELNKVSLGAKKCNTEGDATGTILEKGEAHFAFGLSGEVLVIITLTTPVHVECEGVLVTLTGGFASKVTSTLGSELTTFEGETGACTGSVPAFHEYDNMAGGMTNVELKSETGGVKAKSCKEIEGKVVFTTSHDLEIMAP